ncbi:hypothetical protein B0H14DRAFT_2872018 [Mycena olivaceomarginata]|nr:hypothetical protein B0H14DRAFT_2872018 [Mycena olivaceomarginata]
MTSTPATLNVADTMVQRTPRFYPELEREMFETTAHMYRNTIPTLLRVARRVRYWIEPLLYHTVSIDPLEEKSKADYALLRITDSTTKPADFLLKAVRHMNLVTFAMHFFGRRPQSTWSEAELGIVLRACEGVESLIFLRQSRRARPNSSDARVHATAAPIHGSEILVHGWPLLRNLSRLPALTHLALDQHTPPGALEAALSDCSNLQTLILYGTPEKNTATAPVLLHDQRVVFIISEHLIAQAHGDIEGLLFTFKSCYHMEPVEEDTRARPVADAVENTGLLSVPDPIPDPVENTVLSLTVSSRLETRLEQRIFKEVALLYPEMIPALLRVARRVLDWIEPLLYTKIRIARHARNNSSAVALLRAAELKPENFLAGAVRVELNAFPLSNGSSNHFPWHTQIFNSDNGWSDAELSNVPHRCTGATELALISDLSDAGILSILAPMRPTHLALAADVVANHGEPWSGLPFLQNVTHLHFFDTEANLFDADSSVFANWPYWSQICRLPALTHLALSCQTANTALVLLADVFVDGKYIAQHLPIFDPRLVVVDINWELERGSKHFWDRSDAFLGQKRGGEIKESCYYLELSIHR